MIPALFLDRDGVVNVETNYVHKIEDFRFMEGIFELCARFQETGYKIVVVTNQAGIARGFYRQEDFRALTEWMVDRFLEHGVTISGVYHCPHHPEITGECACRKPNPGMLLEARDDLDLDLPNSVLLGDKESDLEAGRKAGLHWVGLIGGTKRLETVTFDGMSPLPLEVLPSLLPSSHA